MHDKKTFFLICFENSKLSSGNITIALFLAEHNGESMRRQCYGIYIRAMTNKADGIPSQLSDSRN